MSNECIAEVKTSVSHENSCLCSKRKHWLKVCTLHNECLWGVGACTFWKIKKSLCELDRQYQRQNEAETVGMFCFFLFIAVRGNSSFTFHDWNLRESVILFLSHQRNAHNSKPFKATGILHTILFLIKRAEHWGGKNNREKKSKDSVA